jgi:hypothetical protein
MTADAALGPAAPADTLPRVLVDFDLDEEEITKKIREAGDRECQGGTAIVTFDLRFSVYGRPRPVLALISHVSQFPPKRGEPIPPPCVELEVEICFPAYDNLGDDRHAELCPQIARVNVHAQRIAIFGAWIGDCWGVYAERNGHGYQCRSVFVAAPTLSEAVTKALSEASSAVDALATELALLADEERKVEIAEREAEAAWARDLAAWHEAQREAFNR